MEPARGLPGDVHVAARHHRRQRRAARHPEGPQHRPDRAAMGGRRLHADSRGLHPDHGHARRPLRPAAAVRDRRRAVHARVAALRAGDQRDLPALRAGSAGHRRRGDVRDLAGADRAGVPGPRARHRDRRLGRDDRRRGRGRAAGRRGAHRRPRLGVDLLRQRPDRDRHRDPRPDPGRRVARSRRQATRLGGPDHLLASGSSR